MTLPESTNKLEASVSNEITTIPSSLVYQINELPNLSFPQVSQLKKDVENELLRQFEALGAHNADMDTSLITSEGFPRDDLDLVTIRLLKRNVNVLRNDLRRILQRIDVLLPEQLQAMVSQQQQNNTFESLESLSLNSGPSQEIDTTSAVAFAKVVDVRTGSPSHDAGLRTDDLIVRFGTVHALNHDNLHRIGRVVQERINSGISLVIKRDDEIITIQLIPRPWQGAGLLGCRIIQV